MNFDGIWEGMVAFFVVWTKRALAQVAENLERGG